METKSALPIAADLSPNAYRGGGDGSMVFDHDICFVSGDLNYRIDARREVVLSHAVNGNFEALWEHDQLIKQMRSNQACRLKAFSEAPLNFAPTYKYDRCVS